MILVNDNSLTKKSFVKGCCKASRPAFGYPYIREAPCSHTFFLSIMANVHQQNLLNNISRLMDNGKYSDLVIKCNERRWNVHRAIVCSASPVLASECDIPMREHTTRIINHEEFDIDTVDRMISYIYKQTYYVQGEEEDFNHAEQDENVQAQQNNNDQLGHINNDKANSDGQITGINHMLLAHVEVYGIGEFYSIDTLKTFATARFTSIAKKGWEVDGFIDVVKAVNTRTSQNDRVLRDALRGYAMNNCTEMVKHTSLMNQLADLPLVQDFAADMFRQMVRFQIDEKERYEQQLALKVHQIAEKDENIKELTTEVDDVQRRAELSISEARERCEHVQSVMDNLVEGLEDLPETCGNGRCDKEFSNLKFERKGYAGYPGEGNWVVRCGKCRCRLIS